MSLCKFVSTSSIPETTYTKIIILLSTYFVHQNMNMMVTLFILSCRTSKPVIAVAMNDADQKFAATHAMYYATQMRSAIMTLPMSTP